LNHPQSIVEDTAYKDRLYKVNAWGHPWRKVCYSIEELLLNLRYGYFSNIAYAARKRICKWLGLWVYE
ncbi:MAG: hemolysin activation protein, partial [Prevotella sp.]|nr:hemolysin activation protein [Prevotella sp.]